MKDNEISNLISNLCHEGQDVKEAVFWRIKELEQNRDVQEYIELKKWEKKHIYLTKEIQKLEHEFSNKMDSINGITSSLQLIDKLVEGLYRNNNRMIKVYYNFATTRSSELYQKLISLPIALQLPILEDFKRLNEKIKKLGDMIALSEGEKIGIPTEDQADDKVKRI